MQISRISADNINLYIYLDESFTGNAVVAMLSPALRDSNVEYKDEKAEDGLITVKLSDVGADGLYRKYYVGADKAEADKAIKCSEYPIDGCAGKCYVEEIKVSDRTFAYPTADTKKGLQICQLRDAIELGVKHAALNVNLGDFMMPAPEEGNTVEYEFGGKTFYIRKSVVEANDQRIIELSEAGIIITYIMLNSKHWTTTVSDEFWEVIKHPSYNPEGTISQFNVITEPGLSYYRAFVAFLTDRYTREDEKYGRAVGLIVGNEVNSGYVWCNAGEMDVDRYSYEYATAVRTAWQTSIRIYSGMRVYVSLDNFWTTSNFDSQPMKYYSSRGILENLNKYCTIEGQVGWNIAYHPYPQDLRYPDFWNDNLAVMSPDSPRVTFKNLEVLSQFMYRPEFLMNGERRRIILSEQGFNSHFTPESEVLQAMAYGVAYKKVMSIPEIDSFILHAHNDNPDEFGLNLGLWRRYKDKKGLEAPKPIYYVFKAIDKKDEKGVYHWERY